MTSSHEDRTLSFAYIFSRACNGVFKTIRKYNSRVTYLGIGVLLIGCPAMTLVVAPAIVSARWPWIRVLYRSCSCTAIRYLRLVGLVGTLVRLATSSRCLVHPLLGSGPVTGTTGVMHRPLGRSLRSLHRRTI